MYRLIEAFLADMANADGSTAEYLDALCDAQAAIEAAIDAAKEDLKAQEAHQGPADSAQAGDSAEVGA